MTAHFSDDPSLLRLLESDPEKGIELIYKKHQPALVQTAFRLVRNREVARDLVQDVFLTFWKGRQRIDVQTSLSAYLHRSVINAALNYLKKQPAPFGQTEAAENAWEGVATPQHALQTAELGLAIDQALLQLPTRCRLVFSLNRFEELSYKEIAAALQISPKAVEKEMMKALRLLRQSLREYLPLVLALLVL
jgi:RNA polymerase sigma-70 factor (ECF subfamily)